MVARRNRVSLPPADHARARATAALLVAGAALVAISVVLPHPAGADQVALIFTALAMAIAGAVVWALACRMPNPAMHLVLAGVAVVTCVLIYESGISVGQYGTIFVWSTLVTSCYFRRRVAAIHLAWLLLVYGIVLLLVENTAGYSPLTRWLFTSISLSVVMLLITEVVSRREQADKRARRFFELSQDMLCTMDRSGRCQEANGAWAQQLGYTPDELRGKLLLEFTHPADHERALVEAQRLFETGSSASLETRLQAKDGNWHWLRTSSTVAPDEGLVYARSTDVTELKRIEAEREELLGKVQDMATHDSLTGLPNRRALGELLPREMAGARRSGSPLCVAILDIDRFKAYNDTYGHLAGDEVLRDCARAWDSALRGEDTIVRFGGEEFLVVLPRTDPDQACEVVERLRGRTPTGQTCSAGIATWDFVESIDDLLGRADKALYMAKAGGRDQVAQAAVTA